MNSFLHDVLGWEGIAHWQSVHPNCITDLTPPAALIQVNWPCWVQCDATWRNTWKQYWSLQEGVFIWGICGILLSCVRNGTFIIPKRCFSSNGLLLADALHDFWVFLITYMFLALVTMGNICSFYFHTNVMLCCGKLFSVGLNDSD